MLIPFSCLCNCRLRQQPIVLGTILFYPQLNLLHNLYNYVCGLKKLTNSIENNDFSMLCFLGNLKSKFNQCNIHFTLGLQFFLFYFFVFNHPQGLLEKLPCFEIVLLADKFSTSSNSLHIVYLK